MAQYDDHGREIPDTRPVEWPLNLKAPLSIQEEIKRFVRVEMSQRAAANEFETFEEADDFDVADEEEWSSPHELTEMQEEAPLPAKQEAPKAPAGAAAPGAGVSGQPDVAKPTTGSTVQDKSGAVQPPAQ